MVLIKLKKTLFKKLDKIASGGKQNVVNIQSEAFYFPRLKTEQNGAINWNWTGEEISRFITAFDDPYQGAWTRVDGKEKIILRASRIKNIDIGTHPFNAGLVIAKDRDLYTIATRDSYVEARINYIGRLIGRRLITPSEELERAKMIPSIKP